MVAVYGFLHTTGVRFPKNIYFFRQSVMERILGESFYHNHEVTPFHRVAFCSRIIFRYPEPPRLQPLDVHHHPSILGMDQFHQLAAAADETEHFTVAHVSPHLIIDHADQRVYSLAHVRAAQTKMIAHRIVKAEHGSRHALRQHFQRYTLAATPEVSFDTVRKGKSDSWQVDPGYCYGSGCIFGLVANADRSYGKRLRLRLYLLAPVIVSGIGDSPDRKKALRLEPHETALSCSFGTLILSYVRD